MIMLGIDRDSRAFESGQLIGAVLVTLAVMAALWFFTRTWRDAPYAETPDQVAEVERLKAKRRLVIVLLMALVAVLGGLRWVFLLDDSASAADEGPARAQTVVAPPSVRDYALLTGDAAADLESRLKPPAYGKRWFYSHDGGNPAAVFQGSADDWDPEMAEERRRDSPAQGLRNAFAGARSEDVESFDPGPLGGALACGHVDGGGQDAVMCGWVDRTTDGFLTVFDMDDLEKAATLLREFRTAAEKPL
ncbi:hypothetical protein AB0M28_16235 [Streptomyces sp. NPDC051940]|uniref:hypothetical protein n=1 Tax=Streptomyces sp. NPDC051940 TaxID=3155675 RepID=UPI0034340C78